MIALGDATTLALRALVCAVVVGLVVAIFASGRKPSPHPPAPPPDGPDACGIDSLLPILTPQERSAARSLTQLTADPWRDPGASTVEAAVQNVSDTVTSRNHVCQIVGSASLCASLRRPGSTLAKELASAAVRACSATE